MTAPALCLEEVETLLQAIHEQAWDFEVESGNLFDEEPPEDEEPAAEEECEEIDRGWRERDFV